MSDVIDDIRINAVHINLEEKDSNIEKKPDNKVKFEISMVELQDLIHKAYMQGIEEGMGKGK